MRAMCSALEPRAPRRLLLAGQHFGLLRDYGRLDELARDVSPFLDAENATLPAWRAAFMVAQSSAGDIERARSGLTRWSATTAQQSPTMSLGILCLLAEAAAELGDTGAAQPLFRRLEPYAKYNAQIGLACPRAGGRIPGQAGCAFSAGFRDSPALQPGAPAGGIPRGSTGDGAYRTSLRGVPTRKRWRV